MDKEKLFVRNAAHRFLEKERAGVPAGELLRIKQQLRLVLSEGSFLDFEIEVMFQRRPSPIATERPSNGKNPR